jgi:uncharacterized membrane protein YdjX (TVP38/TMEM64 family)
MRRVTELFGRPLLLLAGLLAAGLTLRLLPAGGVSGLLAAQSGAHDARHMAAFVLVGGALCAVGVPRQVVAYACGVAAGLWVGSALALAAQLLGCAANLFWARALGRQWAALRLRGRLQRLDRALGSRPFAATLTLRLLPVGNNLLLNLAAGLSSVAALPFLAASAVGYLPQTVVFALAGTGTRLGQGPRIALALVLFAGSAALGLWLLRRRGESGLGGIDLTEGSGPAAIPPG